MMLVFLVSDFPCPFLNFDCSLKVLTSEPSCDDNTSVRSLTNKVPQKPASHDWVYCGPVPDKGLRDVHTIPAFNRRQMLLHLCKSRFVFYVGRCGITLIALNGNCFLARLPCIIKQLRAIQRLMASEERQCGVLRLRMRNMNTDHFISDLEHLDVIFFNFQWHLRDCQLCRDTFGT